MLRAEGDHKIRHCAHARRQRRQERSFSLTSLKKGLSASLQFRDRGRDKDGCPVIRKTAKNEGLTIRFALAYGGWKYLKAEIVDLPALHWRGVSYNDSGYG